MSFRRKPSMAKAWCGICGTRLPDRDESRNERADYYCADCQRRTGRGRGGQKGGRA